MSDFIITPDSRPEDIAWLGLGDISNLKIKNPMLDRTKWDIENPGLHELRLMKNPQYVYLAAKVLLGINLYPFQCAVMNVLWNHKFPMFIATRGGSKSWGLAVYSLLRCLLFPETKVVIAGAAFRQSKIIFEYMENIWQNSDVLRSVCSKSSGPRRAVDRCVMRLNDSTATAIPLGCLSGDTLITSSNGIFYINEITSKDCVYGNKKFKEVGDTFDNGLNDVKKITTKCGYSYIGTHKHKMKIVRNNKIVWCTTKDLKIGDSILIDRTDRWYNSRFKCSEEQAYVLGCMIGDGSWTDKYRLQMTNKDKEVVDTFCGHFDKKAVTYDDLHYFILGKDIRQKWLDFWELDVVYTKDKKIPQNMLMADKSSVAMCLRGLFDTDGNIQVVEAKGGISCAISFYNTSYTLVKQIHYILLHFGIISTLEVRKGRKSPRSNNICSDCWTLRLHGENIKLFNDYIGFGIKRKQDLLDYYFKKKKRVGSINSNLVPIDKKYLYNLIEKYVNWKIMSKKSVKDRKNITLNLAQKILDACKKSNAPKDKIKDLDELVNFNTYYDKITSIEDLPKEYTYDLNIPEDNEYCANGFCSHNSGDKIRGMRANCIVCDEFSCLRKDTLVQTTNGLIKIKDYINGDYLGLINKEGHIEYPTKICVTPPTDVYEIKTQNEYSFYCSSIHQVMTSDGWKVAKDLTKDDFLDLDVNDYFPNRYIEKDGKIVDEEIGYILGLLISEGTCTNRNYVNITTTDKKFKEEFLRTRPLWKCYEKESHIDPRGWKCKKSYTLHLNDTNFREWLYSLGLDYKIAIDKSIPWCILQSPRSVVISFLKGLFYGDGSCFLYKNNKGKNNIGVSYYTSSKELANELQILLLKFNVTCTKGTKKSKISKRVQWQLCMRAEQAIKIHELIHIEKWKEKIKRGDYLVRKPFIKRNGKRYTVQTTRNNKSVYLGTFDTKEECHDKFNNYWDNVKPSFRVKSVTKLDEQEVLYDFYLPETHSFVGNGFIQHNSVPPDIYETVIGGFAAVESSPMKSTQEAYRRDYLKEKGLWQKEQEKQYQDRDGNQSIIAGTAYYDFNHFADYWKKYKAIIESRGNLEKLSSVLGGDVEEGLNWRDYAIIRIPYTLLPKGFMAEHIIARGKATMHYGIFDMEYNAVFSTDSNGFFKRSLIEGCVTKEDKPVETSLGNHVWFDPMIKGNPSKKYVFGIDPAIGSANQDSSSDNFSIVITELHEDHTRIVYAWSTNRQEFRRRLQAGKLKENQFYGFCARKIRDLMASFPCAHIAMDAQGGGILLYEALNDENNMRVGEHKIWEVIDSDKKKDTDVKSGLHILELCQFAKYDWLREANYGMHKDFNDKLLLFPRFDSIALGIAAEEDNIRLEEFEKQNPGKKLVLLDTFEDCVMEIEELKDELCTIIISITGTGVNARERWDTPEVKLPGGKKGALRKDRYSALLMANAAARKIQRTEPAVEYQVVGGRVGQISGGNKGKMYNGPDWYSRAMNDGVIGIIRR